MRGERFWWAFILKVPCCWMKIGTWAMALTSPASKMVYRYILVEKTITIYIDKYCPRKWCYWKVWTWIWQLGSIYIGHKKKKQFKNNDLIFCQEASNKKYKREFTNLSQIFNGQSGKIINHYFTFYILLKTKFEITSK